MLFVGQIYIELLYNSVFVDLYMLFMSLTFVISDFIGGSYSVYTVKHGDLWCDRRNNIYSKKGRGRERDR